MKVSSTIGGLAGSAALTILNEAIRKISKDAPRLDLLGENALAKFMKGNNTVSKTAEKVFPLAGDLVSNSLFYGMARGKNPSSTLLRGAVLGLSAGIGAITLPKPMGLEEKHTTRTNQTKLMTVAWYVIGGLVAASVINALDGYKDQPQDELAKTTIQKTKSTATNIVKRLAQTK